MTFFESLLILLLIAIILLLAAGLALGAIVAPPDAAAATAVLQKFALPRKTVAILKGESLFNDATALLLFSGALTVLARKGLSVPVGLHIGFAAPGGLLLGMAFAYLFRYVARLVKDTLGGTLLQFVIAYLVWITAEHLRLSAVLCVIGFAMTVARKMNPEDFDARMRVQSYAVWSSVVFTLNVLAFLLMGMQAKSIIARMQGSHLRASLGSQRWSRWRSLSLDSLWFWAIATWRPVGYPPKMVSIRHSL